MTDQAWLAHIDETGFRRGTQQIEGSATPRRTGPVPSLPYAARGPRAMLPIIPTQRGNWGCIAVYTTAIIELLRVCNK